jgi:hypothetical protein
MNKLYASSNRLDSCVGAPAAGILDVSCNLIHSLKGLPATGIQELNVANNHLFMIDFCPESCRRLRASGNRIIGIVALSREVELLEVSKNILCHLDDLVPYSTSLKELFCGSNPLKQIPPCLLPMVQDG